MSRDNQLRFENYVLGGGGGGNTYLYPPLKPSKIIIIRTKRFTEI